VRRGFVWFLLIGGLALLPFILMGIQPQFKYVIAFAALLSVYGFFRQFFGDGVLTVVLTGVVAYYLLYKHFWLFSSAWWIYTLLALGIFGTVGWLWIGIAQAGAVMRRRR